MGACSATIIIVIIDVLVLLWYCYCFFFLPRLNDFLFSSPISRWGHFMWLLPWHMAPNQVLQFHLQRHTWNMLFKLLACRDGIPVTGVILFRYCGPTRHCINKGSKTQVILCKRIQLLLFWQLLGKGRKQNWEDFRVSDRNRTCHLQPPQISFQLLLLLFFYPLPSNYYYTISVKGGFIVMPSSIWTAFCSKSRPGNLIMRQKKLMSLFCSQYWEPCHRCWIDFTGILFAWHGENSCHFSNLARCLIHKAVEVTGLLNLTNAALRMCEALSFLKCVLLFFRAGFKDFAPSGCGCGVLACWMIRFDTKFLEAESTNMRLLVFFYKSETNQVKLKLRDTCR